MVKTVTIKESSYRRLVALKRQGESFSDLIDRLTVQTTAEILDQIRAESPITPQDAKEMIAEMHKKRKEWRRP